MSLARRWATAKPKAETMVSGGERLPQRRPLRVLAEASASCVQQRAQCFLLAERWQLVSHQPCAPTTLATRTACRTGPAVARAGRLPTRQPRVAVGLELQLLATLAHEQAFSLPQCHPSLSSGGGLMIAERMLTHSLARASTSLSELLLVLRIKIAMLVS